MTRVLPYIVKSTLKNNAIRPKIRKVSSTSSMNRLMWTRLYNSDALNVDTTSKSSGQGFAEKSNINIPGLKKETQRQYLRAVKKVSKAKERLIKAENQYEIFMAIENPSDKDFENCPNPELIKNDLLELQERVSKLIELDEILQNVKSDKSESFSQAIELATLLDIGDKAAPTQPKGKKKPKGTPDPPRKPYFIYTSKDNLEIRVGRRAEDNDELSCNPEFRDSTDWWLHVSGAAGSHVIIRSHDDTLPSTYPETIIDAALLAAVNSKGPQSGKATVSLVRARQVSKPSGAKPGLVHLNGDITQVKINVGSEKDRLDRLVSSKRTH